MNPTNRIATRMCKLGLDHSLCIHLLRCGKTKSTQLLGFLLSNLNRNRNLKGPAPVRMLNMNEWRLPKVEWPYRFWHFMNVTFLITINFKVVWVWLKMSFPALNDFDFLSYFKLPFPNKMSLSDGPTCSQNVSLGSWHLTPYREIIIFLKSSFKETREDRIGLLQTLDSKRAINLRLFIVTRDRNCRYLKVIVLIYWSFWRAIAELSQVLWQPFLFKGLC